MNAKKLRKLKKIYDSIPKVDCKGLCTNSCSDIALSMGEVKHLYKITGEPIKKKDGHCTYLDKGRCKTHADRPTICRLWGVTKTMECPFGCKPERLLEEGEARRILADVHNLLDGDPNKFVTNE